MFGVACHSYGDGKTVQVSMVTVWRKLWETTGRNTFRVEQDNFICLASLYSNTWIILGGALCNQCGLYDSAELPWQLMLVNKCDLDQSNQFSCVSKNDRTHPSVRWLWAHTMKFISHFILRLQNQYKHWSHRYRWVGLHLYRHRQEVVVTWTRLYNMNINFQHIHHQRSSLCFHLFFRPSLGQVLRWAESLEALLTNQCKTLYFLFGGEGRPTWWRYNYLFSLVRWCGSVSSLPEIRIQWREPRLLVGCGEIQEDARRQQNDHKSCKNLWWVYFHQRSKTGSCQLVSVSCDWSVDRSFDVSFDLSSICPQVNVDSAVRESTNQSLRLGVSPSSFQLAQEQIFSLMETDSYPRFLRSRLYAQLSNQDTQNTTVSVGSVPVSQS